MSSVEWRDFWILPLRVCMCVCLLLARGIIRVVLCFPGIMELPGVGDSMELRGEGDNDTINRGKWLYQSVF